MPKPPKAANAAPPAKSAKQRAHEEKLEALAERENDRAEARAFGKTLAGLAERVDKLEHFVKKVA